MDKKQNMFSLVLIGALLAAVSVFLPWAVLEIGSDGVIYDVTNFSGWEIFTDDKVDNSHFIPISLALAALALIIALLNVTGAFTKKASKSSGALLILLGVAVAVLAVAFYSTEISDSFLKPGYGIWLSVAGGVLIALPGMAAFNQKK